MFLGVMNLSRCWVRHYEVEGGVESGKASHANGKNHVGLDGVGCDSGTGVRLGGTR